MHIRRGLSWYFAPRPRISDGAAVTAQAQQAEVDYDGAVAQLRTIGDFARWLTSQFTAAHLHYGHGTDNPWDESLALICGALHLPWQRIEQLFPAQLTQLERQALVALARRRIVERVPVPYLTGRAWFAGVEFVVDAAVLIPRSPIAELIGAGFAPWLQVAPARVLDLCTGSGAIGIACALAFPDAEVTLTDISPPALAIAERNTARFELQERVQLRKSDLFAAVQERYSLIVSNPPYVPQRSFVQLPREYSHEPALALVADDEGAALVERILCETAEHLEEDGLLIMEVGEIAEAIDARLQHVLAACDSAGLLVWPEFANGGGGVLVADITTLRAYAAARTLRG